MDSEISARSAIPNRGDSARRHPLGLEKCSAQCMSASDPLEIVVRTTKIIAEAYKRDKKREPFRCDFGPMDIILYHCVACFVGEEEIWNKYPAVYGGGSTLRFADVLDQASRLSTFAKNQLSLFGPLATFRSEWEVRLFFEWDDDFVRKGAGAERTFCLVVEGARDFDKVNVTFTELR